MDRSVIALVTDLIFTTKLSSTAKSLGVDFGAVKSVESLCARIREAPDALIVIDLNAEGVDAPMAIRAAKECGAPRVTAYVSHAQRELAQRAVEAGADEVLPRSAFVSLLPSILTGAESDRADSE
jgi:CheY-like chemotaxis protein